MLLNGAISGEAISISTSNSPTEEGKLLKSSKVYDRMTNVVII